MLRFRPAFADRRPSAELAGHDAEDGWLDEARARPRRRRQRGRSRESPGDPERDFLRDPGRGGAGGGLDLSATGGTQRDDRDRRSRDGGRHPLAVLAKHDRPIGGIGRDDAIARATFAGPRDIG